MFGSPLTTAEARAKADEAEKRVEDAKRSLSDRLTDGSYMDTEMMAKAVNEIAFNEGQHAAYYWYASAVDDGRNAAQAYAQTVEMFLPEVGRDTWSGRANDVRRAKVDGMKEAVTQLRYTRDAAPTEAAS